MSKTLLFSFILFSLFYSCSDSSLHLDTVSPVVVLDYKKADEKPSCFLAVTIKLFSQARRIESVTIKNAETGFCWFTDFPAVQKKSGSDYLYLKCEPSGFDGNLPSGKYSAFVKDLNGNESEIPFEVEYNKSFLEQKSSQILEIFDSKAEKYYALFSQNDELLYYIKEGGQNDKLLFSTYKDASYLRVCYVDSKETVVCLMPGVEKNRIEK